MCHGHHQRALRHSLLVVVMMLPHQCELRRKQAGLARPPSALCSRESGPRPGPVARAHLTSLWRLAGRASTLQENLAARAPKLTRGPLLPHPQLFTRLRTTRYSLAQHAIRMLLVDPSPRTARESVGRSSVVGPEWPFFYASCALSPSWKRLMHLHAQTSPFQAD